MNSDRPDGEYFTDEAEKPIPPKNMWDEMTVAELIDVKAQLEEKMWAFGKNPVIVRTLQQGVSQLEALISSRSSS